ncbi:MAG: site-specific integrase, partial [Syntrophomonadaceae bacterium]|nr:site-specific integrase [Syntrophomonadaceae bacterium]
MELYFTAFMDYLAYEKGLAKNTQAAYLRDLVKFVDYLNKTSKSSQLEDISKNDIIDFLTWQLDSGVSYATAARTLS